MRFLVTADLHYYRPWFEWIKSNPQDVTVIAGDILDGRDESGLPRQILFVKSWCDSFHLPLVVGSGNHDCNTDAIHDDPEAISRLSPDEKDVFTSISFDEEYKKRPHWLDCLEKPNTVTDIRSQVLNVGDKKIIVTTLPYLFDDQSDPYSAKLWDEGAALKKVLGVPWIVISHEPAYSTSGTLYGNKALYYKAFNHKPDFLFSGHLHSQPYLGSFADKIGATWCFNPGHPVEDDLFPHGLPSIPNHIIVDTDKKTALWYANILVGSKWIHAEKTLPLA